MRLPHILLALCLLTSAVSAQAPPSQSWDAQFRAIPDAAKIGEYMRRMSARPHHLGSPYDKDNAEWIAGLLKQWGWQVEIEQFHVLMPTPKARRLEMTAPTRFVAALVEPPVAADPTSGQQAEQLPSYNAYSADGDVTGRHVGHGGPGSHVDAETRQVGARRLAQRFGKRAQNERAGLEQSRNVGGEIE